MQSSDGDWVAVDVTPQFAQSPSLEVTEQRDPENVTEVRPDSVEEVVPPDPVQEDSGADDPADEAPDLDLAWLWPILRIAGIVLFVLALALRALARRDRREGGAAPVAPAHAGTPAARIAGGWDEYVDAAVDAGREAPRTLTRTELAAALATPSGAELARAADRAVFSSDEPRPTRTPRRSGGSSTPSGAAFVARARVLARSSLATVSLRSFFRHLAPAAGARTRFPKGGSAGLRSPCASRHDRHR